MHGRKPEHRGPQGHRRQIRVREDDDVTIVEFAKTSFKYLDDLKQGPDVKKVLDSQEKLKNDFRPVARPARSRCSLAHADVLKAG